MPDPTSDYTPAIRALIDYFSSRVRQNLPAPPAGTDYDAPPTPPPPPGAFQPDQPVVGSPLLAQILRRVLDSGDPRLKAQVGPVVQGLTPSLIAQATEAGIDPNAYNYGAMGYVDPGGQSASVIMGRTDDPDPKTGRSAISVSPAYATDEKRLGALMHELTHVTGDPDQATGSYPEEARALWNAKAPAAADDERAMNAMIDELLKLRDDPRFRVSTQFQAVSPKKP